MNTRWWTLACRAPYLLAHHLGDFPLTSGEVLRNAVMVSAVYGRPNQAGDNTVVYPTFYNGTHLNNELSIGIGRALDPTRYHIVVPNIFGNGVSTSPSNAEHDQRGVQFPRVSMIDNVKASYDVLTIGLGIESVRLVVGFSFGAFLAYQWAVSYPGFVKSCVPICGEPQVSVWNRRFIDSLVGILRRSCSTRCSRAEHIRQFARRFAGWALADAFYERRQHLLLGYGSLDLFLSAVWEPQFDTKSEDDLLSMLYTWREHDVSVRADGCKEDWKSVFSRIESRFVIVGARSDRNFPVDGMMETASAIAGASVWVVPSVWGHRAGAPEGNEADSRSVDDAIRHVLGEGVPTTD